MPTVLNKPMLHHTKISISEESREQLIQLLNYTLAQLIDLKIQVKQAHWNIKGMRFIALHELFDKLAAEVEEYTDMVAERATTLGGIALGTLTHLNQETILTDYPVNIASGEEHLHELITRYGQVANLIRSHINQAEELKDKPTADLFTEVVRGLELRLWFLEAHTQD